MKRKPTSESNKSNKSKSKPRPQSTSLITGGLLGLAGLGLLPQGAEATTDLPPIVPAAGLGEALAADPSPVMAPKPSAQATVPQVDEPPPAWSPEDEQSMAIAAAASSAATDLKPVATDAAVAVPEGATDLKPLATDAAAAVPESATDLKPVATDAAVAVAKGAIAPAPDDSDEGSDSLVTAEPTATSAPAEVQESVAPAPAAAPSVSTATAVVAAAEPAIAPLAAPASAPQPAASQPEMAELTERSEPAIAAVTPAAAPSLPAAAPAARPTTRPAPTDVATIRARAAAVQALMRDLRAAAGMPDQTEGAAASQPASLSRGPQLPPLPSRAGRRHPAPRATATHAVRGSTRAANVALASSQPQPVMSNGRRAAIAPPAAPAIAPTTIAQTPAAAQIRDDLQIAPLTTTAAPRRTFAPSPNAGIPSGFGANGGDIFFSASLSGADRLRPEVDGSLSAGFGLGDSRRIVGLELNYNLLSVRQFGENGGFDAKIHRQVYSSDETEVAAAVGLNNVVSYGPEAGGSRSSLYGVVTAAHLLQPEHPVNRMPITGTLGLGGGDFSDDGSDVGVIAGLGLQLHPQFSLNTAWSGVGLNVGASIVPVPTLPMTLNLLYGDIGNNTAAGSVAVLSIGYGFNFGPRF